MTGGGSSSRRPKASPGVMESELPTHHRPDPAAVQQQQHEVMDGLDFEYNPLSSYALGSGASHLERISMSGPDGEFDSARGKSSRRRRPGSARKKDGHGGDADQSFRLDFSEGVQKTIEASDELHPRQKHVWEFWAPYRLKPRSKITWLRSIFYPNSSRPFPWKLMLMNAMWTTLIVVLVEIPSTHLQFVIDYLHEHSADIATFVGMSTFFLTIILSFRVNQAYNRWWEARTLWGAMINDTRDMAVKALVHVYNHNLAVKICLWITVSADLLRNHLRGKRDLGLLNALRKETEAVSPQEFKQIEKANHRILTCFWKLGRLISEARERNLISPLMHLHLNEHIQKFNNHMGAMERILRCPMPIGYTCMIRTTIVFWMFCLPFALMPVFGYASIPIDIIITWFICGLEETAAELENPFGIDPNDLPLEFFTTTIRNNIFELLASYETEHNSACLSPAQDVVSPVEECPTPMERDFDSPTSEGVRSPNAETCVSPRR
ncbi:bestrophin [Chloropicon roscoffensis]|uniref:Bestrophin n=2 Tax=Chloropicon roscoffensis TaxID=1461544 RepID=A0AAX4PGP9_9CHLO